MGLMKYSIFSDAVFIKLIFMITKKRDFIYFFKKIKPVNKINPHNL